MQPVSKIYTVFGGAQANTDESCTVKKDIQKLTESLLAMGQVGKNGPSTQLFGQADRIFVYPGPLVQRRQCRGRPPNENRPRCEAIPDPCAYV